MTQPRYISCLIAQSSRVGRCCRFRPFPITSVLAAYSPCPLQQRRHTYACIDGGNKVKLPPSFCLFQQPGVIPASCRNGVHELARHGWGCEIGMFGEQIFCVSSILNCGEGIGILHECIQREREVVYRAVGVYYCAIDNVAGLVNRQSIQ